METSAAGKNLGNRIFDIPIRIDYGSFFTLGCAISLLAPLFADTSIYLFFLISSIVYRKILKVSFHDILIVLILCCCIGIKGMVSSPYYTAYYYQYYFGFIPFYWLFKHQIKYFRIDFNILIIGAFFYVLLDAIFLNTSEFAYYHKIYQKGGTFRFFDFYYRPKGFLVNSSRSGAFISILLLMARSSIASRPLNIWIEILGVITALSIVGGVSYIYLGTYLIFRIGVLPFFTLIAVPWFSYQSRITFLHHMTWKISPSYIYYIFETKVTRMAEIKHFLNLDLFSMLFGRKINSIIDSQFLLPGGDSELIAMAICMGLVPCGFFLIFILLHLNRHNFLVLALYLIGSLHYGLFNFGVSKIMFGAALCLKAPIRKSHLFWPIPSIVGFLKRRIVPSSGKHSNYIRANETKV